MNIDIAQVEVNKNIVISQNVGTQGLFKQNVQVSFIPDVMIVRGIFYQSSQNETTNTLCDVVFQLTGDTIGSFLLQPFVTSVPSTIPIMAQTSSPVLMFEMKRPVTGDLGFQIFLNGGLTNTTNNARVSIYLDFIKFKTVKPDGKVF